MAAPAPPLVRMLGLERRRKNATTLPFETLELSFSRGVSGQCNAVSSPWPATIPGDIVSDRASALSAFVSVSGSVSVCRSAIVCSVFDGRGFPATRLPWSDANICTRLLGCFGLGVVGCVLKLLSKLLSLDVVRRCKRAGSEFKRCSIVVRGPLGLAGLVLGVALLVVGPTNDETCRSVSSLSMGLGGAGGRRRCRAMFVGPCN
mmetsp:Transcript_48217/g.113309  ORF Transcript_48217/g.113309 Transcript_48217/m.113309 type:complete len:204 (+) Transcript_48217:422-1033(+)